MSVSHKSSNTQLFRLMLYRRALHPELFDLQLRRCHRHGDYEVEAWLEPSGHVVRFQVGNHCLAETVVESGDHLPEHGLIYALPCIGEKDYELENPEDNLGYVTTIQTESLTDNLYGATLREMRDFASDSGAMIYEWRDNEGHESLSMIDVQKYRKEFHFQCYHLIGGSGLVLRTQSIFEVL